MTGICNEHTLKALNKIQLIGLFLKMQDQENYLIAEMKGLNPVFKL